MVLKTGMGKLVIPMQKKLKKRELEPLSAPLTPLPTPYPPPPIPCPKE